MQKRMVDVYYALYIKQRSPAQGCSCAHASPLQLCHVAGACDAGACDAGTRVAVGVGVFRSSFIDTAMRSDAPTSTDTSRGITIPRLPAGGCGAAVLGPSCSVSLAQSLSWLRTRLVRRVHQSLGCFTAFAPPLSLCRVPCFPHFFAATCVHFKVVPDVTGVVETQRLLQRVCLSVVPW